MADKLILERINKRNLNGIHEDIKTYLSPILDVKGKPEDGDLKEKGMFAVKFLHTTVSILGNDKVPDHLISAVHVCCQGYQIARQHIKLQDELTVPKLVYHIISKIVQEDQITSLYQLGTFLYTCLQDFTIASNPGIKSIVMSSYSKLWNGSVKHESACDNPASLLITTQLRFLAVKFLFKKEKMEDSDVDKVEIALGRYILLASKLRLKKTVIQKGLGEVLEMYIAMLSHILGVNKDQFYLPVIKLVTRAVKYLYQYKMLADMESLQDFIQELNGDQDSEDATNSKLSLLRAVAEVLTVIKLIDKMLQDEAKTEGSIDEVSSLLSMCNERVMTFMDASAECSGQEMTVILETCQLVMIQLKAIPLTNLLSISFVDAARMTMTLYLHFLESEWRRIGEVEASTSGLRRDQVERNMLDAFHVKFQMFYRLIQIVTDNDELQTLMGECLDAVGLYLNVLGVVESDKTRFDDKYYFGYLMVKFGHFCYNGNLDELATEFYRHTCQQLTEWCFSDEEKKQSRIAESSLWKIYKCLAECHRRRQMWQEGLETIATYLHIDVEHITPLVQLWVRIKRDAVRAGHQHFTEKTLKDAFSGENESSILSLLQAELEAFKDMKKRWSEGEVVVLQEVVAVTTNSGVKAGYLLSLAQAMWIMDAKSHRSPKECVSEVLDLTTSDRRVDCIIRAQAHIWRFIMAREDLCKQYVQPLTDPEPEPLDDDVDSKKTVKEEPLMPCKVYTLQQSEADMADMEKALELLCPALNGDLPDQIDRMGLVNNLTLAASVFRLFRRPVHELQVLCLALRVCPVAETQTCTQIRQTLSRVLVECGQYEVAEVSLPAVGDNGLTCDDSYQRTLLQLQRDRIHLTEKVESGLTRTQNVVKDMVRANNKSWTATLTEGIAKRLLSMYLIQPIKLEAQDAEYALALAQEAVKLHTAVVHFLLGKEFVESTRNKDPHVLERWMVVTELLESILHLGHLYRHVGDAKDARCYLKEGLKITKGLCLPRWTVEFLLELGRINSVSSNKEESLRLLAETSMVLRSGSNKVDNGPEAVVKQKQQKSVSSKAVAAKKRSTRGKSASTSRNNCKVMDVDPVDDCFGFESVRDAGLKRPSESDVTSMLSTLTLSEDQELPELSPHNSDCSCSLCQDIVVQGLEMMFSETLGEFYQYSGSLEKGWEELKKIESSKSTLDKLTANNTTVMLEHLKSANIVSVKNKKSKSSQLSLVLLPSIKQLSIESYGLLAQTALKKCESDTADFLSKSALEMLDSESNKDLLQQSFLKAQLQLLQIQAKIQAGGDVFVSTDKPVPVKSVPARGRARVSSRRKASAKRGKIDSEETDMSTPEPDNVSNCVKETLTDAFGNICHFPSSDVYGRLCRILACQHLDTDQVKTAYYLGEAVSITFRHQALANTSRKIRKFEKEIATSEGELVAGEEGELQNLRHVRSLLTFNKDVSHFQQMLKHIPPEWTVCQITMVKGTDNSTKLLLTRLTGQTDPITVQLPGLESVQGRSVLTEFKSIMKMSSDSMKLTDKNVWWQTRRDLNDRVQSVVELIEKFWLGKWIGLLQGQLSLGQSSTAMDLLTQLQKDIKKTCKMSVEESLLQLIVSLCLSLPVEDQKQVVVKLLSLDAESDVTDRLTSAVSNCCSTLKTDADELPTRQPVLLVLDKDVQHLPWESLPSLRSHPVTRIPSLYHLHTQLSVSGVAESHACVRGVNLQDTYYILNPDNDLMSTQESFQNIFSSQPGWSGLIGEKPGPEQFKSALTQHDLFIYCGHGSGGKYYSGSDLRQLPCKAVAVLMGCSSGYLQARGILEATGMINNYFLAGCPTIIANLWDVTDRDIDRFLEGILTSWMASDGEGSLLDPIPAARDMCRLPFLIGAAPVVYGFPVSFTR